MNEQLKEGPPSEPHWLARQAGRLVGVALTPKRTLFKAAFEPDYWVPIFILAAGLLGARLAMMSELRQQYASPEFRQWYSEQLGASQEKASRDIELMIKFAPWMAMFEAPLVVMVGVGGVAFVLHLLGRLKYKSTLPYRNLFNMTAWASVVGAIPLYFSIPLKLVNPQWTLPTSPAMAIPPDLVGQFTHRVLMTVDVFILWQAWLLSVGISLLFRIGIQRAVSSVGTMFVVFAVVNAFLSAPAK